MHQPVQGRSRDYKITFDYPAAASAGNYYMLATVQEGGTLRDLGQANNTAVSPGPVTVAPAFVSLAGSTLSAGPAFTVGKTAVAIFTVTNDGNVQAKGSTTADLILSADQTAADGTMITAAKLPVSLPADKGKIYRISFKLPKTFAPGTYYLIAVIDPTESLGTNDRTNSAVVDPTSVVVG